MTPETLALLLNDYFLPGRCRELEKRKAYIERKNQLQTKWEGVGSWFLHGAAKRRWALRRKQRDAITSLFSQILKREIFKMLRRK